MAGLGGPELIIVLIIFVLLFGAKKLPELGSSIGKGIKNFKRGIDEAGEDDEDEDERHVTNEGSSTRSDQT
jgi:sec-independent protein translocase protein TatA